MPKPTSERLVIVRKLAERRESQASSLLKKFRDSVTSEQQQLSQLHTYYSDYLQVINQQHKLSPTELKLYRDFSYQLAQSVQQLEAKIAAMEEHLKTLTQRWSQLRHKRQALEALIDTHRAKELNEMSKMEQKFLDELTNNQYFRQNQQNASAPSAWL